VSNLDQRKFNLIKRQNGLLMGRSHVVPCIFSDSRQTTKLPDHGGVHKYKLKRTT